MMAVTRITPLEALPFRPIDSFSLLRIDEPPSLAAVLERVAQERRADPGARFLVTLDDIDQCCYTSGHARQGDEIYYDADGDFDDPVAVAGFEQARLRHVVQCLDDPALRRDWRDAAEALTTLPEDVDALLAANRNPDRLLDSVVFVQKLPVERDDLLIAGLPNGYFTSDWDIFSNHAVIRLLGTHGYRFFGIGASWLGFIRDGDLGQAAADQLMTDLAVLYAQPGRAEAWNELGQIAQTSPWLLLGYTDNFIDILDADDEQPG